MWGPGFNPRVAIRYEKENENKAEEKEQEVTKAARDAALNQTNTNNNIAALRMPTRDAKPTDTEKPASSNDIDAEGNDPEEDEAINNTNNTEDEHPTSITPLTRRYNPNC